MNIQTPFNLISAGMVLLIGVSASMFGQSAGSGLVPALAQIPIPASSSNTIAPVTAVVAKRELCPSGLVCGIWIKRCAVGECEQVSGEIWKPHCELVEQFEYCNNITNTDLACDQRKRTPDKNVCNVVFIKDRRTLGCSSNGQYEQPAVNCKCLDPNSTL